MVGSGYSVSNGSTFYNATGTYKYVFTSGGGGSATENTITVLAKT